MQALTAKAGVDLAQGKAGAAAINGAATALALANLGLLGGLAGKLGKGTQGAAETLENSVFNSTTLTKLLNITAKELEHEFNLDVYKTNVVKGVFGESAKKTEDDTGLPKLPQLPELPKLQSIN